MSMNAYDTEQAKALLAEAGYPDGIELTLLRRPTAPIVYQSTSISR
ncbi:MAG: hypothetical protein R3E79_00170 [Caldilineaceae bacterium]